MLYLSLPMGCALAGTVERESVRETGELLKTTASGGDRGCSGLVFDGKSMVVWETKKSEDSPPCCLFCSTDVVKCLLVSLGHLNHPLMGKEKLRVALCSVTEPGRGLHTSPPKVQYRWCAPEPAEPSRMLDIS